MPIIETKILNFKTKEIHLTYTDLVAILASHDIDVPENGKLQITYESKSKAVEVQDMQGEDKLIFRYTILELS
jgi:peptide deformylase